MPFEWDERKRIETLQIRGLNFATAWRFFDGRPVVFIPSPQRAEERWKTVALIEGAYFTLVWVKRGEAIRIISMRRSHEDEERAYRTTHPR
jgi:uncharacterized DUF497 family protein